MHRRRFLTALTATLAARGAQSEKIHLHLNIDRPGASIPDDFLGFGYEVSEVAVADFFSPRNLTYIQFLRTLGPAGVLRIGGNTSDFSSWSPDGQAVSAPQGTVVNRSAIADLGGFLRATGWKLIWTLNTATVTPGAAADEAAAVAAEAGEQLVAFELGNEPDMFVFSGLRPSGYGYPQYLAEFGGFAAAVRARVRGAPLAGPAVLAATDWTMSFAKDETANIRLLTQHYYINDQSTPFATLDTLLQADPRLLQITQQLAAVSASTGLRWRLAEANSFSGGGKPGVSDTFASALWALDLMFILANAGAAGINWETGLNHLGFVSSYSPIFQDESGYSARPSFYALLAFRYAAGGRMLTLDGDAPPDWLGAWAFRDAGYHFWTALINKSGSSTATVSIEAPTTSVQLLWLTGPSLDSTTGVQFAAAQVSASGMWSPRSRSVLRARDRVFSVDVPPASALLLRFL